jgi:ABC-type branched-subunit amino acid transport system ATPase component
MNETLLEVRDVVRSFGGICAVDRLSFDAERGGITGLIGPNGAGKTTVFNLITGVYRPASGSIRFEGAELTQKRPDEIVRCGVARTFQNVRLFKRMSCLENVMTPLLARVAYGPFKAVFCGPSVRKERKAVKERACSIMEALEIVNVADRNAFTLSYGQQRKLEIARALACSPKLLLLDEPAAGMNDAETEELAATIGKVQRDFHVTIVLIEHHISLVMSVCTRIVVMARGALLASGTPQEVREDERVVEAYLGRHRERENVHG